MILGARDLVFVLGFSGFQVASALDNPCEHSTCNKCLSDTTNGCVWLKSDDGYDEFCESSCQAMQNYYFMGAGECLLSQSKCVSCQAVKTCNDCLSLSSCAWTNDRCEDECMLDMSCLKGSASQCLSCQDVKNCKACLSLSHDCSWTGDYCEDECLMDTSCVVGKPEQCSDSDALTSSNATEADSETLTAANTTKGDSEPSNAPNATETESSSASSITVNPLNARGVFFLLIGWVVG